MKAYAPLGMLQAEIRTNPNRQPGGSADASMLRFLERATQDIDQRTGRRFNAWSTTRYYSGYGHTRDARDLYIGEFASITGVTVDEDDDGTYELTLVADTDYRAVRVDDDTAKPIVRLELMTRGTQLAAWPAGQRAIKIVGLWGWSNESEAIVAEDGTAITGTLASTSDISLVLSANGHGITPGDTLLLADEQVYVTAKIDDLTVRVTRGQNGTTAATPSAVAVSRRRYPRDIEAACVMRAADLARGAQSGWATTVGDEGGFQSRTSFAQYMGLLAPYTRMLVV